MMVTSPTTTPPSPKVDWKNLPFNYTDTNGYVMYMMRDGIWDKGKFVRGAHVPVHVCSPALNYGQQCFEGLKAFRSAQDGKVRIFRPQENAARIRRSADMVSLPIIPEDMFLEACKRVVSMNLEFVPPAGQGQSMYIRPLLFGQGPQLGLAPPEEFIFIVFCTPVALYYPSGLKPVSAWVLDNFDRTAPLGTGSAKLGGNYAPVMKPVRMAKEKGYALTLHLDSRTHSFVDEFSISNFIAIQNGQVPTIVSPASPSILKSITTKSLLDIAQKIFEWNVETRPLPFAEVRQGAFDEVAACGTAAIITPVRSISFRPHMLLPDATEEALGEKGQVIEKITIGDSDFAGPGFTKLYESLRSIQDGKTEDKLGWLWPKEGITGGEYA